jgi:hypothetical protein
MLKKFSVKNLGEKSKGFSKGFTKSGKPSGKKYEIIYMDRIGGMLACNHY